MSRRSALESPHRLLHSLWRRAGTRLSQWWSLPAPEGWAPRALDEAAFARELDALRRRHDQIALAAAVIRSDGPIRRAVVGTLAKGDARPALPAHRFHAGSITKSFTAVLAAQFVEEGRLTWETTLADALPDMPMRDEYRSVTLHDLLVGASGVLLMQRQDHEPPEHVAFLNEDLPRRLAEPLEQRREMARFALSRVPRSARGTRHEYSNVGWALAGHVLEMRAAVGWEVLVRRRIFDALGMAGARVGGWPASPAEPDQPRGHVVDVQGLRPQALDDAYALPAWMNPAGGLHMTIDDFAMWAREMLRGLRGHGRLLPVSAYERLHAPHCRARADELYQNAPSKEMLALGYGWLLVDVGRYRVSGADGSAGTFYARLLVLPSHDVAFAALVNSGAGEPVLSRAIRVLTGLRW